MLYEFLTVKREEVIQRCRAKVGTRFPPSQTPAEVSNGVPIFLQQLTDTLKEEQSTSKRGSADEKAAPSPSPIGQSAALHGAEMLRLGFTVDQVVHDYGDVCQSVTDMAVEEKKIISADEFRTLNRCLDEAIADAVTSYNKLSSGAVIERTEDLHKQLNYFVEEQRRLIDVALQAYTAIKTGNIGLSGATGTLLMHSLKELRVLADQIVPEIRLASVKTTLPSH
jgi:hypothetical protein